MPDSAYMSEEGDAQRKEYADAVAKQQGVFDKGAGMVDQNTAKQDEYQNRGKAQANWGQSNQDRQSQNYLGNKMQDAVEGRAPSVAQEQMQRGQEAGLRQQMAMAASARGGAMAQGAAQRQAMSGALDSSQQTAAASAQLRAGEMATARDQYANLLNNQRTQDMNQSQQDVTNYYTGQGQNDQMTGAYLGAATTTEGNLIGAAEQENTNASNRANAQLASTTSQKNQASAETTQMIGAGMGAAGAVGGGVLSDIRAKTNIQPITSDNANGPAPMTAIPIDNRGNTYQNGIVRNEQGQAQGMLTPNLDKAIEEDAAKSKESKEKTASLISKGVSAFAGMKEHQPQQMQAPQMSGEYYKSDERSKDNKIQQSNEIEEWLDNLKPYEYDYKNPAKDGAGKRIGVMAQDMEKSPIGSTLVGEDNQGMKYIDGNKTFTAMLAALADLNKKQNQMEQLLISQKRK